MLWWVINGEGHKKGSNGHIERIMGNILIEHKVAPVATHDTCGRGNDDLLDVMIKLQEVDDNPQV